MYDYRAMVIEWHDGDTVKLDIDEGFGNSIICWIRFYGVSTPELREPGGIEARDWCEQRWPIGSTVLVSTKKPSSGYREFEGKQLGQTFARWLGIVYPVTGMGYGSIGDMLVTEGLGWHG